MSINGPRGSTERLHKSPGNNVRHLTYNLKDIVQAVLVMGRLWAGGGMVDAHCKVFDGKSMI